MLLLLPLPLLPLPAGVRSFLTQPILSTDGHGVDKHKMERHLAPGQHLMATCYAPIAYPPLPLLVRPPPHTRTRMYA